MALSRKPIRARRATPRRRSAPRWEHAQWEMANQLLYVRSGGSCERCGIDLTSGRVSVNRHHRMRRNAGGDRLSNLLLLCGTGTTGCHGWITTHPEEAVANGWSVRALGDTDSADVPVRINGYLWLLSDDGSKHLVP